MANLIGETLGGCKIFEEIGRGGMAIVYKALQPSLNRHVAIKVLPPTLAQDEQFVQRFRAEAQNSARLKHPNIVVIHDVGEANGYNYIVMELLEGITLKALIERDGALKETRALNILAQIASALDYAHAHGFIHRDIKPSNIIVGVNDVATLTDFGIAKAADSTRLTRTGMLMGTPEYMSPEQARGEEVNYRADIYSLGVVAYEMFSGRIPYSATTPHAVLHKVIYEPPVSLRAVNPRIPPSVEQVISRALAKEPENRFPRAADFTDALRAVFTQMPSPSESVPHAAITQTAAVPVHESPTRLAVQEPRRQTNAGLLGLAAGLTVLLIVAVALVMYGLSQTNLARSGSTPPTQVVSIVATPTLLLGATVPIVQTIPSATRQVTLTPTVFASPTQNRASTPVPTPTLPKLSPPRGVTFKFDDGVPPDQRELIQTGMAMAQNVFGDAGNFTVYAYANVNALLDEVGRTQNVNRADPANADWFYRNYQSWFDSGGYVTTRGFIYISAIGAWQSQSVPFKLSSLSFGYFDQVRSSLAGTAISSSTTGAWINYGILTWAQNAVLFKYGYVNQEQFRRDAMHRSRGILNPLSVMEVERTADSEDGNAKRYLGYLALDYLAANYGGEQAVFRKFWENWPKYSGLQPNFKATFGVTTDEFYAKFEEYRRAQFSPYCGTVGSFTLPASNAPISIRFVRQEPPGAVTFSSYAPTSASPAPLAYIFCVNGYPLASYQNQLPLLKDWNAAIKLPPGALTWFSCGGSCLIVYVPQSVAPGTYTFAIELQDKRRAEVQFQHSILPAVTPRP